MNPLGLLALVIGAGLMFESVEARLLWAAGWVLVGLCWKKRGGLR